MASSMSKEGSLFRLHLIAARCEEGEGLGSEA